MGKVDCKKCSKSMFKIHRNDKGEIISISYKCLNMRSKYFGTEVIDSIEFPVNKICEDIENPISGDNLQIRANHTDGSIVIENARDRFVNLLNSSNADTFESIVTEYIHKFSNTISADECCQIIQLLSEIQYPKIAKLNNIKRVAREHAGYLEKYLDGKLYTDEDSFEKYREVQKNNAEAIINVCNE